MIGRIAAAALMAALVLGAAPAGALEKLIVGTASPGAFSFLPANIGMDKGFFQKNGVELKIDGFEGSAKLHQAMTAGSIDIGLGAGSDLIFPVKGAPETAVADLADPPLLLSFVIPWNSPIKTPDDLKGKRIGVSTLNSLTEWIALQLAHEKGWGPNGVKIVAVGVDGMTPALLTGQVDALVSGTALGLQLAEQKKGRNLMPASDVVKDFMIHAIFASNKLIATNPDAIRRFLKGWFETIAFMYANKDETVRLCREVDNLPLDVEQQQYDIVMPMFSRDGKFHASALKVIQGSYVELHLLDKEPDLSKYITEKFLPTM
jgi:NitT/TauT family transport system substrate-binding protein